MDRVWIYLLNVFIETLEGYAQECCTMIENGRTSSTRIQAFSLY